MKFNLYRIASSIKANGYENLITVYNAALGNSHKYVRMTPAHETNRGNFVVRENVKENGQYGIDYVVMVRLDDLIYENVLLMKIDVETFEYFVLDGARNLLCNNIVENIVIEYEPSVHQECSTLKFLNWMSRLGYKIMDTIPNAISLDPNNFKKFPPNLHFELQQRHDTPAKLLGGCPSAA
eukprot:767425-Hanusia_phi.AAC.2